MAPCKAILLASYCLQLAYANWAFHNGQPALQQQIPHSFGSGYPPVTGGAYIPSTPGSSWQFNAKSGVPTWIITTTEIETRNETVNQVDKDGDDPDSPVGPNLREDGMTASAGGGADESEDPDVEFPVRHGKEPAVRARPAFADPDKYEETTTTMPLMGGSNSTNANQTKTVTVNRTTVVKIEFVNTPFLPIVLRLDSSQKPSQNNNTTGTSDSQQQPQQQQESTQRDAAYMGPNQGSGVEQAQYNQYGGSASREQSTGPQGYPATGTATAAAAAPQDSTTSAQGTAGGGLHLISGSPISYATSSPQLPPVPLAPQQLYYPQFVNYWKRR